MMIDNNNYDGIASEKWMESTHWMAYKIRRNDNGQINSKCLIFRI